MSDDNVGIGIIKYLTDKRGVIEPKKMQSESQGTNDLYFEVSDDHKARRLRKGQLVQFVVEDDEAKQVTVLSESA